MNETYWWSDIGAFQPGITSRPSPLRLMLWKKRQIRSYVLKQHIAALYEQLLKTNVRDEPLLSSLYQVAFSRVNFNDALP